MLKKLYEKFTIKITTNRMCIKIEPLALVIITFIIWFIFK